MKETGYSPTEAVLKMCKTFGEQIVMPCIERAVSGHAQCLNSDKQANSEYESRLKVLADSVKKGSGRSGCARHAV